jgi:hypothetical protein
MKKVDEKRVNRQVRHQRQDDATQNVSGEIELQSDLDSLRRIQFRTLRLGALGGLGGFLHVPLVTTLTVAVLLGCSARASAQVAVRGKTIYTMSGASIRDGVDIV